MDIKKQLATIGIEGKKADVYLAILQLGKATVIQIAKKSHIKRPTTYDILEDLLEKKLVSQTFQGKRRFFIAEDPKNLKIMLKQREENLNALLPELESLYNLTPQKPKIKYYEGIEGIKQIYEDYLTTKGDFFYFGSIKDSVDLVGKEYMKDWVKRRIKKGIEVKTIRIKEKEVNIKEFKPGKKNLRELKFFPIDIKESFVNLVIYDNKVAITSSAKESYGIIIESQELATSLKYIWQIVWGVSKSK